MRVKAKTAFVTRMDGEAVSVARNTETDLPEGLARRLADAGIVEIDDAELVDTAELERIEAEKVAAAEAEKAEAEKAEREKKSAADQVTAPKKRAPANKRVSSAPENK